MATGRRLLKIDDVLRQLQELDDEELGPEENTLEEQVHSDEDDCAEENFSFIMSASTTKLTMRTKFSFIHRMPTRTTCMLHAYFFSVTQ